MNWVQANWLQILIIILLVFNALQRFVEWRILRQIKKSSKEAVDDITLSGSISISYEDLRDNTERIGKAFSELNKIFLELSGVEMDIPLEIRTTPFEK
jgi:regulatory protein YycI of two-component signal transduction system YycFG